MTIERLNEDQIRCVLTGEDLEKRQIRLSELAYGTEKARALFHDLMQQAAKQCDFHVDNVPLMIEAIPMEHGALVLIVTKVDDPEELDTRFSSFGPAIDPPSFGDAGDMPSAFEQLIDSIRRSYVAGGEEREGGAPSTERRAKEEQAASIQKMRDYMLRNRLFSFKSLSDVCGVAAHVAPLFTGKSALYYAGDEKLYYLFLSMNNVEEVGAMQHVLAAVSEFGTAQMSSYARHQQLSEHAKCIFAENALQQLAAI